jgi:glycosyltransferase involved in cell wall biosynthesis
MVTSDSPDLIYLGRSRLHRNRANLIQTLHTIAALEKIGISTRLYLPPWHKNVTLQARLDEMGISPPLDIRAAQLLHRRWPQSAFIRLHKRMLSQAMAVYVRSHHLSLALGSQGIRHHFEVHTLSPLIELGMLTRIIDYHRRGIIDWLIPISRNLARLLVESGADEQRIHISPSGVELDAFQALPEFDPEKIAHPRIVYLGRISRDRGLPILTHLAACGLGEVHLIGDRADEIAELPHLHYRPAVPHREVPGLYGDCELVVLPYQPDLSHADGISPMKLFEAMAAGRAVIASDIAPIREVVKDGINGLLADPTDPASWEHAVERLTQNPELAQRIARQAKADAAAYDWQARARGIAQAIGLPMARDKINLTP